MKPMRMPETFCTNCNHKLSGASSVTTEDSPSPGDITICLYCGHIMAFKDDLTVRELTPEEVVLVAGDPDIAKNQELVGLHRQNFGKSIN